MEKSLKFCLNSLLLACLFASCGSADDILYQKVYTTEEQDHLARGLITAGGNTAYYQGTIDEQLLSIEALKYDPDNADAQRELGVPYLKRGFAHGAYQHYSKAAALDPETWAGYMAYCWLYFYRDYEKAIELSNICDAFTPNFTDYPQSTSVDYMRGISHLKLANYTEAKQFLNKHMDEEIASVGEAYISSVQWIALAQAYHLSGDYEKAEEIYEQGYKENNNSPELYYHRAANFLKLKEREIASKHLDLAQQYLDNGGGNQRPYVTEFFVVFQRDIDMLRRKI